MMIDLTLRRTCSVTRQTRREREEPNAEKVDGKRARGSRLAFEREEREKKGKRRKRMREGEREAEGRAGQARREQDVDE